MNDDVELKERLLSFIDSEIVYMRYVNHGLPMSEHLARHYTEHFLWWLEHLKEIIQDNNGEEL